MSGLLRSLIDFDGGISQENLTANYAKFRGVQLEWVRPDDKRIVAFVEAYFQQHKELPQKVTLLDHFGRQKDIETVERVKDLEKLPPYVRTNYAHQLAATLEEQTQIKAVTLLKEAMDIARTGIVVDGEKRKGVKEALAHVALHGSGLVAVGNKAKLEGDLRKDGQDVWDEYAAAKADKSRAYGIFTGLNNIDTNCHGIKKGELWIHAGFAGSLKTTFALNWAYNLVTRYRSNVLYVSLEMTYEHLRRLIFTLHSAHKRFELEGYNPLDYRKVRDGELESEDEAFFQTIISDFNGNPEYGRFEVWRPAEEITIDDIRVRAEHSHRESPIDLLVIDHGGLVDPRKEKRSGNHFIEMNSVVRDSKKLALNFNGGEALPVLLLWQINRQGKERADKRGGVFDLGALAEANEAEKSADVVTTTYLDDDLRAQNIALVANLKNRDNPLFAQFEAQVLWSCRRLRNLVNPVADAPGMSVGRVLDDV